MELSQIDFKLDIACILAWLVYNSSIILHPIIQRESCVVQCYSVSNGTMYLRMSIYGESAN